MYSYITSYYSKLAPYSYHEFVYANNLLQDRCSKTIPLNGLEKVELNEWYEWWEFMGDERKVLHALFKGPGQLDYG